MMDDEDTAEKRRQRSDEARRAAMRQKIQQQKERDRQIAVDIANVDKKGTKRIVFEDSDDDDDGKKTTENGEKTSSSRSSKRPKLFDSEDENEKDGEEVDDALDFKNRHSGPKGEKLMQMEARFNSDPRFKLDDKFADSDSDDDGNQSESAEKQEMKLEKDKNRELLSKILGKSVEEKKPKSSETASLKARPFTRFDPENPEHLVWMKAFEASKNPQKAQKSTETEDKTVNSEDDEEDGDEEEKNENKEIVEDKKDVESGEENFEKAEIFFKMDEKFSTEMKERKETGESSSGGFSFLSMMGRKYDQKPLEIEDSTGDGKEERTDKSKEKSTEKVEKVEKALHKVKVTTKFFVDPLSDEKIKSLAANFRRTQTVEKVIDKWAPHRDAIFKLWKKQRRDAVKKQKESFFTNGKRKRKTENENREATVNS